MGELDPGLSASKRITVEASDTAQEIGSGDVPVLATPRVLALAESTCVEAIAEELEDGRTTVGAHAEIDHERASPVGAEVDVEAKLIGHHGRRLEFNVTLRQGGEVVATVRHRRMIVDRERFLRRCGALNGDDAGDGAA